MSNSTASVSLCDRTLDMLKNRSIVLTYKRLADEANLSAYWIEAFRAGNMDEPSVHKVQRLHDVLFSYASRA